MTDPDLAERPMTFKEAASAIREFSRPYKGRVWAMAALALIASTAGAAEPLVVARLFDAALEPGSTRTVFGWLGALLGLAVLFALVIRCRDRCAAGVAADVSRDLRIDLADRALHTVGTCKSLEVSAVSGVQGVTMTLGVALPAMISGLTALTVSVVTALLLDWRAALVVVAAAVPIAWLNVRLSDRARRTMAEYTGGIERLVVEAKRFFPKAVLELVGVMRARPHVMSRIEPIARTLRDADEERLVSGNFAPPTKVAGAVLFVLIVAVAVLSDVSPGTLAGFLVLARLQVDQLIMIVVWFGSFANHVPDIQMVDEALAAPTERTGGERLTAPQGRLELGGVTATYADGRRGLNDMSFTLRPGEVVAIVGESGGGKTTVTRLASGSEDLEITQGVALLDGVSLDELELDFLRATLLRVPQSSPVFDGTVVENLLPPEGVTRDDVERACRLARVHDQIMEWPDGYDTKLRGEDVSGGQAQRLRLAGALLRLPLSDTRAIVLDEPTAALDPPAADEVLDGILSYTASLEKSALVITHKLPVHPRFTRVVVMHAGRVIEDGDPRKLAANPESAYARLLTTP